jgi:rhamnose transport system permease protein
MTANTSTGAPRPLPERSARSGLAFFLRWEWMLVLLIILVTIGNTLLSPFFLQTANLMRASSDFMELGLMMLPMVFVIISNNIDLSVASTLGLTASFMGWLFNAGWNIWAAAAAALVLGLLAGAFNGLLISRLRLPALVVTLGTYAFYRGLAYALLGDEAARGYPEAFNYLGQGRLFDVRLPFSVLLFAVLAVIFGLVLHKSAFGRQVYAIGNNEEAARFSGVPVQRNKLIIFTVSGLMAALAGLVLAARFGSTRPDIGTGLELDVITATVLGGISINGGRGTMPGAVLSLILIGLLRYGMSLLNIQGQVQSVVIGLLLIGSILLPNLLRGLSQQRGRRLTAAALWKLAAALLVAAAFLAFFFWSRALVAP